MTRSKRMFDIVFALFLAVILVPVMGVVLLILAFTEGRPLFYISERMHNTTKSFALVKLRTMRPAEGDSGVTGGDKAARVSPIYRILRKSRIDEIPQLWNVLKGDMTFVGPRPPLRMYVAAFPDVYAQVLQSRPGLTGLATLRFHQREETLLAGAGNSAETDAIYRRRCIPRKAQLDLIYQRRRSFCFDLVILWETGCGVFRR